MLFSLIRHSSSAVLRFLRGARDLWRDPVFRREAGLIGRKGAKRWRNPLWRTAFFALLMIAAVPAGGLWAHNNMHWRGEEMGFAMMWLYLAIAALLPAVALNRRLVWLIKTGQLEHLSLTLERPDMMLKAFYWSNMLKFWPLIPAGIAGELIMLAVMGEVSRHDWDEMTIVFLIALTFTTFLVANNALFSLWASLRYYRSGATLLFLLIGLGMLDFIIVVIGFLGIITLFWGMEEFTIFPIFISLCVMLLLLIWGHARAYLDGNFIEELTGGRDAPHRPYGDKPWWRLPLLKLFWRQRRWRWVRGYFAAMFVMGAGAGAWVIVTIIIDLKFTGVNSADNYTISAMAACIIWMAGWMWVVISAFEPGAPAVVEGSPAAGPQFKRAFPLPLARLLIGPPFAFLIVFCGAYYVFFMEGLQVGGILIGPIDETNPVFNIVALTHILFYLFALSWLVAKVWRRGGKGWHYLALAVALIFSVEVATAMATKIFLAIDPRNDAFLFGGETDAEYLERWWPASVILLAPIAGWLFVRTLHILRETGAKIKLD